MSKAVYEQELSLFDEAPTIPTETVVGENGVDFRSPEDERAFDIGTTTLIAVATTKGANVTASEPEPTTVSIQTQPTEAEPVTHNSERKSPPRRQRRVRRTSGRDRGYSYTGSFGEEVPPELR